MLEHQDRNLWDKKHIAQGREILREALARGVPGPYQIQAAISAIHADARRFSDTDWHQITLLYGELFHHQPSDVVALNAAVALSYAASPAAGLVALGEIANNETLATYQPFHAARADMLRRNDQVEDAAQAYDMAISLTRNVPEKLFLERRKKSLLDVSDSASAPMPGAE